MPNIQENGTQRRLHDFEYQLSRCTQTSTDDWHVWTPWVYLVRRLMVVRRRQLLFYSNGIQLQRIPRYLLDRISDASVSIGPGGPFDRELTRWSAAGMAHILDQTPEGDFADARENLHLYRSGVGRYSDVVVARDITHFYQAGLGRYPSTDEPSSVSESIPPALESTAPTDVFSAPFMVAADLHTRSFAERMRTPLPPIAGVVPDNLTPEQLQRTAAYFADLRERRGWPHHELRPGELPAPGAPRASSPAHLRRRHAGGPLARKAG